MADNNNTLLGKLPTTPNPALKKLEPLIGTWKVSGPDIDGEWRYEWMEGGFFMIQHFNHKQGTEEIKGIEYTGFDEDTQTLRSRLMGTDGSNFTYTYDIEGDTLWYWFGDKGSEIFMRSTISQDGKTITGRWQWPVGEGKTGGYTFTMTRLT
jgi:hypothetical protein